MDVWTHINFDRATRANREKSALWMLDHLNRLPELLDALAQIDHARSVKAAYILEMMALKNFEAIVEVLPKLALQLNHFKSNSSQRALLHMMTLWLAPMTVTKSLDKKTLEAITEHCFDKLIGKPEAATAVQAHAMSCLYYLSRVNSWITEPLRAILIKNMPEQSPGFKARARHILEILPQ